MIPTVEIGSLLEINPSREQMEKQIRAAVLLNEAFEEWGLAYVSLDEKEKGLASQLGTEALEAANALFSLPADVKNAVSCSSTNPGVARGYLPPGAESGGKVFERKEGFSYSFNWDLTKEKPTRLLEAENQWPSSPFVRGHIRPVLDNYYDFMGQIMQGIALALSMTWTDNKNTDEKTKLNSNTDWLQNMIKKGDKISLMRCFHYFPGYEENAGTSNATGSVQHTDWGFATLITQNEQGGTALQVFHQGTWIDVPPVPNTLVVNCGDFASLLSGGRLHSPLHRVLLTKKDRTSLVYFQYPNFDTTLPDACMTGQSDSNRHLSILKDQSAEEQSINTKKEDSKPECFGEYIAIKWEQVRRAT